MEEFGLNMTSFELFLVIVMIFTVVMGMIYVPLYVFSDGLKDSKIYGTIYDLVMILFYGGAMISLISIVIEIILKIFI